MKKCKVVIIFVLLMLITGSSFLTYNLNIESKQSNFLKFANAKENTGIYLLDYIYVHGYKIEPEISEDNFDYEVKVPVNTKHLDVSYRAMSMYTTSELSGNDNLSNGSIIKIKVTSGNGRSSGEYRIKVIYSNSKLIMNILIVILVIIILGGIIGGVLYYLNLNGYIHIEFKKKEKMEIGKENYVK